MGRAAAILLFSLLAMGAAIAQDTKPLEGKMTVDEKVSIEAQTMANAGLRTIAEQIANEVQSAAPASAKILIYNDKDVAALVAYRSFVKQIGVLERAYDQIAPSRAIQGFAVIPAAVAAVKSVIDLLALFRTDVDIKGVTVTMDELALVSEVSGRLAAKNRAVYVSQLYPFQALSSAPAGGGIQELLDSVDSAASSAAARAKKGSDPAAEAWLKQLDDIRKGWQDALAKVPADGTPLLNTLLRGESLAAGLGNGDFRILYLKILGAGGSNRVTHSLWTGSHLAHSGGAIANYILFKDDGSVAAARTLAAYSGYTESVRAAR